MKNESSEATDEEAESADGHWVVQTFEQMTSKSSNCYAYVEAGYALPQRCAGLPWNINIRGKFVPNTNFTMTVSESLLEVKLNDRADRVNKFLQVTSSAEWSIPSDNEAVKLLEFVCAGDTIENVPVVKKFLDGLLAYFTEKEVESKDSLQEDCRYIGIFRDYFCMILREHKDNLLVVKKILQVIVQIMVISAPVSNQGGSLPYDGDTSISFVCDRLMQPNFNDTMKLGYEGEDIPNSTMLFASSFGFVDHLCEIIENSYIDPRCLEGINDEAAAAMRNAEAKLSGAEQDESNAGASDSLTPEQKALGLASLSCILQAYICLACLMAQNSDEFPIIQYICEVSCGERLIP